MSDEKDAPDFDDAVMLALALASGTDVAPRPHVKAQLLERLTNPVVPPGFSFRFEADADWAPHPVPGIRMRVLSLNLGSGYATLLLDVSPGARFPAHFHDGAEECYVVSGSLYTCDRRMTAGDFLHADANTDHGELWTDEGCRVILVTPPEDFMIAAASGHTA